MLCNNCNRNKDQRKTLDKEVELSATRLFLFSDNFAIMYNTISNCKHEN